MEVESIMQAISNLGFPVACVVVMFLMWQREVTTHKEETSKLAEAVNNNTLVMQRVLDKIGGLDK